MTPVAFWRKWRKTEIGVSDKMMAAIMTLALSAGALLTLLASALLAFLGACG